MRLFWPFRRRTDDAGLAADGPRLLVATFRRLLWYFPATAAHRVVQEGRGRYYGTTPAGDFARDGRVHVVSRPNQEEDDRLLLLDHRAGTSRNRIPLASRDTHGSQRAGDQLYVTDTFRGRVLAYSLPDLSLARVYDPFTHEHHVNTVHVEDGLLHALCHNKGPSFLSVLDVVSGDEVRRYERVGEHSHDLVRWRDRMLICDSRGGGLIALDLEDGGVETLWADEGHFTKGLAVARDTAWFAVSRAATRAERISVECDLVELDLATGRESWRRRIPSLGLVNAIVTHEELIRQSAV